MIAHISRPVLLLIAGLFFCGCATSKSRQPLAGATPTNPKTEIRNNAASLLYDLVGNEKNVSKILIIKRNTDELGRLIKSISEATANYQKQLESLATNDATLNLHSIALPPGEKATRDAIAKTKEHVLLFSSGKEFEFNLLMTQAEAMNYGSHLAKVAAENSSSPDAVQKFSMISQTMKNLYGQVIDQMRSNQTK